MKLRFLSTFRQLLSPIAAAAVLGTTALAQQPAAAPTGADYVRFKPVGTAQPRVLQGVLITGAAAGKVTIKDAAGEIGYSLTQIDEIRKAVPAEWATASQAIEAGELDRAIPLVKAVADKFAGLPTAWAQDAAGTLGGLYITSGNLPAAENALSSFEQLYPGAGAGIANIGKARLAAAKSRFSEAKGLASPVIEGAMGKKNISRADSQIYGQAFYVLGQCAEGEKKDPEAMDFYCRTVALFYADRATVAAAQKRIDELRKKGVAVP